MTPSLSWSSWRFAVLLLVCASFVSGCPGEARVEPGAVCAATSPAHDVSSPQAFDRSMLAQLCAYGLRCGLQGRSDVTVACAPGASLGLARFALPADPGACLDAIEASDCATTSLPEVCGGLAIVGNALDGSPCTDGTQCVSGRCVGADAGCGSCMAPGAEGATCAATSDCLATLVCIDVHCAPLHTGALGARCDDASACASGLECRAGECAGAWVEGESCSPGTEECGEALYCRFDETTSAGACALRLGEGDACEHGGLGCGYGLVCASDAGSAARPTCERRAGVGCACLTFEQCPAGYGCGGGRCVPGPRLAEPCNAGAGALPCADGGCFGDVCAYFPPGTPCEAGYEFVCEQAACLGRACASFSDEGQPCGVEIGALCRSGLRCEPFTAGTSLGRCVAIVACP